MVSHARYLSNGRLKQEDCKFEDSLGYLERPFLNPHPIKKINKNNE
jgi:hypothetical protein